jgi:endonuclease-3
LRVIPTDFLKDAHHWLILLGRYTCKARAPACPACPIRRWCEYDAKSAA